MYNCMQLTTIAYLLSIYLYGNKNEYLFWLQVCVSLYIELFNSIGQAKN